jgi:arylsulfatase A-like enzyme
MTNITHRLLVIAFVSFALCCGRETEHVNVMIVGVDTLRPDHLGCYGYERNTSPNIDRFAELGVLCENAVSQAPWTLPSFATVFTSLYPTQHGAMVVKSRVRESLPTLASILKDNGYATGAIVNAPALKPLNGVNRGFDYYDMTPPEGRTADGTTRDALEWIDDIEDQPFFIFVHYFDPHLSYSPPPPHDRQFGPTYEGRIGDSFDLEGFSRVRPTMFEQLKELSRSDWNRIVSLYDGEIAFTDLAIEGLLQGLKRRGLDSNTLIVFLSDHGEEFFEHGGFEHGHTLYDEIIRVPLIFYLPGTLPQNVRVSRQVRLIDVMPTILDILDIDSHTHIEGVSLKSLLRGRGRPAQSGQHLLPPEIAYCEAIMHGSEQKSVSAYPQKLIYDMATENRTLFDLANDPGEMNNVFGTDTEAAARLEQALFETLFGISDTWYIELAAGQDQHAFDLKITAEKGLMIGNINVRELLDSSGNLVDTDRVLSSKMQGSVLRVNNLDLRGRVTLAFKVDPPRIPLEFDFEIDGKSALGQTYIGQSLLRPEGMPFIRAAKRARSRSEGRPAGDLSAPYVMQTQFAWVYLLSLLLIELRIHPFPLLHTN